MKFTFDQYQAMAARTMNPGLDSDRQLANMAMGLAGETGELVDLLKKSLFHGKPLDKAKALAELGDVQWYIAGLATALGADLGDDVARPNIVKLTTRYPQGFSAAASEARADTKATPATNWHEVYADDR